MSRAKGAPRVSQEGDAAPRVIRTCTRCGGQIGWMPQPSLLPPGFTANCWEGWFHLDERKEHFGGVVGWTHVKFEDGES